MEDFSDLYEESIESLGTTGYCDLAAEVLLEVFPQAQIYRFTDGDTYRHVFLVAGERAVDITGLYTLEVFSMKEEWLGLRAEPTSIDAVREYFSSHGRSAEERRIVTKRFTDHVALHPVTFAL